MGAGFRILAGVIGVVTLVALISVAMSLIKVRNEVRSLQSAPPGSGESGGGGELEALRAEVAGLKAASIVDREDAAADRKSIMETLVLLLMQHEAGSSQISALIAGMSDEERQEILRDLAAVDAEGGHRGLREEIADLREGGSNPPGHGTSGEQNDPAHGDSSDPPTDPLPGPGPDPTPGPTPGPEPTPEPEPTPGPEPAPVSPADPEFVNYTVVTGDYLSKIARKHSVSADAIVKANGITNPNHIAPGDVLKIPVKK